MKIPAGRRQLAEQVRHVHHSLANDVADLPPVASFRFHTPDITISRTRYAASRNCCFTAFQTMLFTLPVSSSSVTSTTPLAAPIATTALCGRLALCASAGTGRRVEAYPTCGRRWPLRLSDRKFHRMWRTNAPRQNPQFTGVEHRRPELLGQQFFAMHGFCVVRGNLRALGRAAHRLQHQVVHLRCGAATLALLQASPYSAGAKLGASLSASAPVESTMREASGMKGRHTAWRGA